MWLFFVLSAFLLTCKFETSGFGILAILRYALGRLLRILPLFTLAIIAYHYFGTAGIDSWGDALDCLFFNRGFVHLWNIPVEFKFYFYLPILACTFKYIQKRWGLVNLLLSFSLFLCLHQCFWPYTMIKINAIETIWYLPCFGSGIILAHILMNSEINIPTSMENLLYMLILLSLTIVTPGVKHVIFSSPFDTSLSNKFLLIGGIWSVFIFCVIRGEGWISNLMHTRLLRKLGHCSSSVYLFHWLVYIKLVKCYTNNYFAMFLAILAAILLGAFIFKIFEAPIEKMQYNIMNYLTYTAKSYNDRYFCESRKI